MSLKRWERNWGVWEKNQDESLSGSGGVAEGEENNNQNQNQQNSNGSLTGSESPFKHPSFKGMTEEQIAEKLGLYEATVKEQGRKLNEAARNAAATGNNNGTQTAIPDKTPSTTDFWTDPSKATQEIVARTIEQQMATILLPFKQDLARSQSQAAWNEAKVECPDLEDYRPWIEAQLTANGVTEPNSNTIKMLYYSAVGLALKSGKAMNTQTNKTTENAKPLNPQHPPSRQPLNTKGEGTKKDLRDLTEMEERMRRERNMSKEEFLMWMDADEGDVTSLKMEKKNV